MRRSLLAICVLVASACAAAPETAAPTPAAAEAPGAPAATPAAAAPAAKAPAFAELVGGAKAGAFKITYKFSGTGAGEAGEQTWYVKAPKFRYDFATGGAATSMFVLETGTYVCTTGYGQAACFGVPGAQASGQNLAADFESSIRGRPSDLDPNYEGARTIAGQPAHCYAVKAKAADLGFSEARLCYRQDGLLLLSQWKASGYDFTMEATNVGVATDADFQLPAKPTTP